MGMRVRSRKQDPTIALHLIQEGGFLSTRSAPNVCEPWDFLYCAQIDNLNKVINERGCFKKCRGLPVGMREVHLVGNGANVLVQR